MSFGMIIFNQNIDTIQNYATWIQIALSCILKDVYEDIADHEDLIHQLMKSRDHYQ